MAQRRIRWGLIGAGDISRKRVASAIRSVAGASLDAVASRRVAQAVAFAREHSIPRVCASAEELLADPSIDAVYIATPVDLHASMTITAARAGKHVLCEKPMALDLRECREMTVACRRAGVRLGVAYYRRFYPIVRRMKDLIERGAIGAPALAEVLVAERFNPEGIRAPRHWLIEKERSGGGPMMDFGCHRIDLLIHLLGEVRDARAELRNMRFTKRTVEDHATAMIAFGGDGEGRAPSAVVTATHCLGQSEDRFVVYGTEGKIEAEQLGSGVLKVTTKRGERSHTLPPHSNLHYPIVRDFCLAVREGRDPAVSGEEGARTSRVLDLIYGRPV